jgi:hypothetical protein
MAEQNPIHKNTFEGGLNTDLSKNIVNSNQYTDAQNVTLVNTGNFLALEDIKGTALVKDLIANTNTTTVLRAFNTKYQVDTVSGLDGITIFTHTEDPSGSANAFKILAYVFQTDTVYTLYEETVDDDYLVNGGTQYSETNERVIDGVLYPENGIDILYFTDFYNRPRKLRCVIPSGYSGAFLDALDLDLLKVPALGLITLDATNGVSTGGSLLTGSYQLAYQLYNQDSNKYSGFSLLSNPIHVYNIDDNDVVSSGVGLASNRKIVVDITPTEAELAYYTHFRVAVVENIGTASSVNVGIMATEALTDWVTAGVIVDYEILSNSQYQFTTIDELVIDLAAIERVKTIAIKDNRLLLGNIINTELEYDNNEPSITGGSVIRQVNTGSTPFVSAESDLFVSLYRGYFRDEVYRFCISYFDDLGNFSSPKTLDLSSVTHNQISGATDMKFPKRSGYHDATYYSILDANSRMRHLGLQITGIDNHPSWAKGFIILRAKRKKNILYQTPLVPMAKLYGLGSVGSYPTAYQDPGGTTITDTSLSPPGPTNVFVPQNLFFGEPTTSYGGTVTPAYAGTDQVVIGESTPLTQLTVPEFVMFFPPKNIYENTNTTYNGSEKFQAVDAAACRLYLDVFNDATYMASWGSTFGCRSDVKVSGSFFSVDDNLQFFDNAHAGTKDEADIRATKIPLKNTLAFDNYDEGGLLSGSKINKFGDLFISGLTFGGVPTNHRSVVSEFNNQLISASTPPTGGFAAGALTLKGNTGYVIADYPGTIKDNEFLAQADGLYANRTNVFEINNVVADLDDARYGNVNSYNELIWTGTKVVFTDAEVAASIVPKTTLPKTVNIWGGDCVVSPHTFKISDTTYSIVNQAKYDQSGARTGIVLSADGAGISYGKGWSVTSGGAASAVSMPVFYDRAAQYLTVILESEYNGSAVDHTYNDLVYTNGNGVMIFGAPSESRSGFNRPYTYNINLNKENDQRVFVPVDSLTDVITRYKSRIYYSDLKVYQTDIDGFDTLRVGNIYDLPETYGALTKLAVAGDRLYALQQLGISVLPVGERIIETTDTSQLAVRSGEFLGDPVYVDTLRGCQHIASVVNTGKMLYFLDFTNKAVCALDGNVQVISGNGLSSALRSLFSSFVIDRAIVGAFDARRDQYYIVKKLGNDRFVYVWNQGLQKWESNIVFPELGFGDALVSNNKFLTIGKDTTSNYTSIHEAHAGNYSQFMGTYVEPSVTFAANPEPDITKVYDALLVNSNAPLNTLSALITTEKNGTTQSAVTTAFDTTRGEGNYKVKIGRNTLGLTDADTAYIERLRGPYANIKMKWGYDTVATRSTPVRINSVLTKFRPSSNIF